MDFMSDSLDNGRKFRTFNVIDDYNREELSEWALKKKIKLSHTQPGHPTQNAFIESLNRTPRRMAGKACV